MTTMFIKLATAVTCLGLACPGIANAEPLPGIPDIPEVDETFALDYAFDHQREICSIVDYRFTQANPVIDPVDAIVSEVATRGEFNTETAWFTIGAAMAASCPQHLEPFEAALGEEIA